MNPALLVIDIQHWFFQIAAFATPEGKGKVKQLVRNTNQLIDYFKEKDLPVIHILTEHKKDGSTRDLWAQRNNSWVLIEGTKDVEELSDIHKYDSDIVVKKTRTNSFLYTDLDDILKSLNIDTVLITGYSTNKCVGITAIAACERDYDVILSRDAILGPRQDKVDAMSIVLKSYGIVPKTNQEIIQLLEI